MFSFKIFLFFVLIFSEIHKYEENEYILDTTPMSVSDVLSPMSVDRSASASHLFDDSNSKEIAEQSSDDKETIPRNDRQRFFEVVEYQRSILEYFRESEVSLGVETTGIEIFEMVKKFMKFQS